MTDHDDKHLAVWDERDELRRQNDRLRREIGLLRVSRNAWRSMAQRQSERALRPATNEEQHP